jgi:hypothetical protein
VHCVFSLKDTSQEDDRTVQNCTLRTENDTPQHSDKVFAVCTHLSLPDSPIQEESNAGPTAAVHNRSSARKGLNPKLFRSSIFVATISGDASSPA